jgi:hypothetical protein
MRFCGTPKRLFLKPLQLKNFPLCIYPWNRIIKSISTARRKCNVTGKRLAEFFWTGLISGCPLNRYLWRKWLEKGEIIKAVRERVIHTIKRQ